MAAFIQRYERRGQVSEPGGPLSMAIRSAQDSLSMDFDRLVQCLLRATSFIDVEQRDAEIR